MITVGPCLYLQRRATGLMCRTLLILPRTPDGLSRVPGRVMLAPATLILGVELAQRLADRLACLPRSSPRPTRHILGQRHADLDQRADNRYGCVAAGQRTVVDRVAIPLGRRRRSCGLARA